MPGARIGQGQKGAQRGRAKIKGAAGQGTNIAGQGTGSAGQGGTGQRRAGQVSVGQRHRQRKTERNKFSTSAVVSS